MIGQFMLADYLNKRRVSNKNIILILAVLQLILYILLVCMFYRFFHSVLIVIAVAVFFTIVFIFRMKYLKKYLSGMYD